MCLIGTETITFLLALDSQQSFGPKVPISAVVLILYREGICVGDI